MGTPIELDIPHQLGKAGVRARLDGGIGRLGENCPSAFGVLAACRERPHVGGKLPLDISSVTPGLTRGPAFSLYVQCSNLAVGLISWPIGIAVPFT